MKRRTAIKQLTLAAMVSTGATFAETDIRQTKHMKPETTKKISKTATFQVNGKIDIVFPLFGAFEEKKWADGWNPYLIYPSTETMEEGTTFSTVARGHDEKEFLWIVSKFKPSIYLVEYLVSTENRHWTIHVTCVPVGDKTDVTVTYTYIGHNEKGNIINEQSLKKMYSKNLTDWQTAINHYLSTGTLLKE